MEEALRQLEGQYSESSGDDSSLESEEGDNEAEELDDSDLEKLDDFYCVACDKLFKTKKAK
jgi:hypothetical protein